MLIMVGLRPWRYWCTSRNLNLTFQGYKPEVEKILRSLFCYSASTGRKFIWGEVYFFKRWYTGMTEETVCPGITAYGCPLPLRLYQNKTSRARNDSQQESRNSEWWINNAWRSSCIFKSAKSNVQSLNFQSQVDQMTEGLKWLNETFGVDCKIGYQIDPFGHSSFTPLLFHLLDYDYAVCYH